MPNLADQAKPTIEKLLKAEDSQLYEQLGMRAKAIADDPTKAGLFEPHVVYDQAQMGLKEDVLELGQRLFQRWNREAHNLVCGAEVQDQQDRSSLLGAFGIDEVAVAAALSALLVTNLGIAPALAAVVAVLLVKHFFRPGYEEFCQVWKKSLGSSE